MTARVFTITHGDFATWQLRARENNYPLARMDRPDSRWGRAPLRLLAQAYEVDSDVWDWLRAHGTNRPSPSGTNLAETERTTVAIKLRIEPADAKALRALAATDGTTVSAMVAGLVAAEKVRREIRETRAELRSAGKS